MLVSELFVGTIRLVEGDVLIRGGQVTIHDATKTDTVVMGTEDGEGLKKILASMRGCLYRVLKTNMLIEKNLKLR